VKPHDPIVCGHTAACKMAAFIADMEEEACAKWESMARRKTVEKGSGV